MNYLLISDLSDFTFQWKLMKWDKILDRRSHLFYKYYWILRELCRFLYLIIAFNSQKKKFLTFPLAPFIVNNKGNSINILHNIIFLCIRQLHQQGTCVAYINKYGCCSCFPSEILCSILIIMPYPIICTSCLWNMKKVNKFSRCQIFSYEYVMNIDIRYTVI